MHFSEVHFQGAIDCNAFLNYLINSITNSNTHSCISTTLECGANEQIQILNGKTKCACASGYIRLKDGEACIDYDPCTEDHRKAKKINLKTCQNANAECKKKDNDSNDFECECKSGFYNEFGMLIVLITKYS